MYSPKWRFMSLSEIKADHQLHGGKTELLTVSLDQQDVDRYFLAVNNETTQKPVRRLEKIFGSEEEGWKYIEELQKNPKYAVVVQPT